MALYTFSLKNSIHYEGRTHTQSRRRILRMPHYIHLPRHDINISSVKLQQFSKITAAITKWNYCRLTKAILTLYTQLIYTFLTYHTLGYSEIVSGWIGGRLIRSSGVTQDGQLLYSSDTAFTKSSELHPVRRGGLVGIYYEVVSFTCNTKRIQYNFPFPVVQNLNIGSW